VNANPTGPILERRQLRELGRHPGAATLRPFYDRYAALVFSSACRRTGDAAVAESVTAAVFLVLSRRARRLSRKTVIAGWLFHITKLACRKYKRDAARVRCGWFSRLFRRSEPSGEAPPLSHQIDEVLDWLPARHREAVLLRFFLQNEWSMVASAMRSSEKRVRKLGERGWTALLRILARRGVDADASSVAGLCAAEGAELWSNGPSGSLFASCEAMLQRPVRTTPYRIGRRVLWTLGWARWRRRVIVGLPLLFLSMVGILAGSLVFVVALGWARVRKR